MQVVTQKGLKWNKNKGAKGYLLVVDDAGVVGVLRGDVRLLFVRVPIDGELDGGGGRYVGGRCAGSYVESSDGVLDGGGGRCAGGRCAGA
jgi:hypothetical protein